MHWLILCRIDVSVLKVVTTSQNIFEKVFFIDFVKEFYFCKRIIYIVTIFICKVLSTYHLELFKNVMINEK